MHMNDAEQQSLLIKPADFISPRAVMTHAQRQCTADMRTLLLIACVCYIQYILVYKRTFAGSILVYKKTFAAHE